MRNEIIVALLLFSSFLFAQSTIPAGTILPIELNSSLNSKKSKAGGEIKGTLAQDVPLPSRTIRRGSKVTGKIISVTPASSNQGAQISLRFDTVRFAGERAPIATNLRAIASMMDVHLAQIPSGGPDRGTSEYSWVTEQIGGETNYHGGWPVTKGSEVVGQSLLSGGVLTRVGAGSGSRCRGEIYNNDRLQALWVFASDACETYGFDDLAITHAGRTDPVGEIVLTSQHGNFNVRSGSGILLRVIPPAPPISKQ
jgi:hypothetical protein